MKCDKAESEREEDDVTADSFLHVETNLHLQYSASYKFNQVAQKHGKRGNCAPNSE